MPPYTLFLLSPANLNGERAKLIFKPEAAFPLAAALQGAGGAPLGDVFSFVSGLYFRGKKAYAEAFGRAPTGLSAGLVISPSEGLRFLHEPMTPERLRGWADVPIDEREPRFVQPLIEHARALDRALGESARFVLLGSVATNKYVTPLGQVFGDRLLFPPDFIGRGDMSRGSLLLQAARTGVELPYAPVLGAARRGPRPAGVSPSRRAEPAASPAPEAASSPPDAARPELVVLVGLPGAGKSTFAAQRFEGHERISRDDLRRRRQPEHLHGELIARALRAGRSVVVDDTNVGVEQRAALIATARAHGARVSVYLFTAGPRECVARNALREGRARVPSVAIFAAARRLVRPGYAEGFDALYCVRALPGVGFEVDPDDATS